MSYANETIHQVAGVQVVIKELKAYPEFHVWVAGEKYEVFQEDGKTGWFTEIGGEIDGPFPTAEELINTMYLSEDV